MMRLSKDNKVRPIDLTPLNVTVDSNGVTLLFWMYPIKPENSEVDSLLFSLTNYTDIVLTNKSSSLRVSLYNSTNSSARLV